MADVVYADLNLPEAGLEQPPQACNFQQCPRWHYVALRVGSAGYVLLLVAVVVLSISVLHSPKAKPEISPETKMATQESRNRSDGNSSLDRLMPFLKQHVCEPEERTSAENAIYPSREKECHLCPKDWLFHGSKCYKFFDKSQKNWNESNENCAAKKAQMLVIQDSKELMFIENTVKSKNPIWIGLHFNSKRRKWFWVDDSPFQTSMWSDPLPVEEELDSCGTLKGNTTAFDSCKSSLPWVCQINAFVI